MELAELTSFVGRVWELQELRKLMAGYRMVTLTGAGGCGKSRLAYRLTRALGVRNLAIVELATVNDPDLLAGVAARALGSPDSAGANPTRWLVDHLSREPALLVWDNCEHLADACAALAATLLKASDGVQLLCTSRQPLGVPGEKAWLVPSLSFPTADSAATATEEYESVRLFIDRATTANPGFRLTGSNAGAVAGICARLEGIPLAIELAAARANVLAPAQILSMLDDALSLLESNKGFVPRQRTLESTLNWSYRLLSEADRVLFRRIGVFAGSFDIDAVVEVCCDAQTTSQQLIDALGDLIDRSLIVSNTNSASAQYHMLEPVRQYALRLLKESDEEQQMRHAHLAHYLAIAQRAEPHLMGDRDQPMWLAQLDRNLPDIRTALAWASTNDPKLGARLATDLGWFWWLRAYLAEGGGWMRMAREAGAHRQSLMAKAIRFEAHFALREGDNRRAARRALEALRIYRELGDEYGVAMTLFLVGASARSLGYFARARVLIAATVARDERLGNVLRGNLLGEMGVLAMLTGDFQAAEAGFREAAAIQRANGDRWGLALTLANCAELDIRRGKCQLAAPFVIESFEIMRPIGDAFTLVQLIDYAGMIALAAGDTPFGLRLMGAASSERRRAQLQQTRASRDLNESWIQRAEGSIGAAGARRALEQGENARFLELLDEVPATMAMTPSPSGGLSRREREVARLIGEGMTNREIAERLFISSRTAEGHVMQILNKLGFQRRSQIASWVSKDKLSTAAATRNA